MAALLTLAKGVEGVAPAFASAFKTSKLFEISLAQWSLQSSLFKGKITNMDFPSIAKKDFDIDIVEYVSVFFNKNEGNSNYLAELRKRSDDIGVRNHLIMVDGAGDLGNVNPAERQKAISNHFKWLDAAKAIGCNKIRVNAGGIGGRQEVGDAVVSGLAALAKYAKDIDMSIVVENHGGYSSNGAWLADVIKRVDSKYCGTLPDFGNFRISNTETYDLYKGVGELLPYAKGISAKTFDFDSMGNEPNIDYIKLFRMIKKSGFRGIVGIEWEGNTRSEYDGIKATKVLLEKVRNKLS